ncbi:hypothetical protein PQB78_gp40 [Arthrobacter phage Xenomorph]|uniref:Uncharacterized protein n=1 Tax=Arthrobacter phage Xenomorph TaxID=2591069 RepID=A0A514A3V5_9CAUD|nr:hypothetical protein PQB78_gp40 [Arthrobacter phage Xenomorph]QDH47953.1 hypothetical protein SEA_XENOMORPH_40 [Arthrobacter phage Xenomorph]
MNADKFNRVIEAQLDRSSNVLLKKSTEYATDTDRLHNFKVAAALQGCDAKKALQGMMAKHTVSIYDMCNSNDIFGEELWNEKITDHINYLLLLQAVVTEEREKMQEELSVVALESNIAYAE